MKNYGKASLLLNLESPSQCNGVVTGWNFCFYRAKATTTENDVTLSSTFSVYRKLPTSNYYLEVPNSRKKIIISQKKFEQFSCTKYNLISKEYFRIQPNDVIGACVPPQGKFQRHIKPIKVAGYQAGVETLTYQSPVKKTNVCSSSILDTVNVTSFIHLRTTIVHVTAQIGELVHIRYPFVLVD